MRERRLVTTPAAAALTFAFNEEDEDAAATGDVGVLPVVVVDVGVEKSDPTRRLRTTVLDETGIGTDGEEEDDT